MVYFTYTQHRRDWVEERLLFLSSMFSIDFCVFVLLCLCGDVLLHTSGLQLSRNAYVG
jgi:hypothetical protein